MSGKVTDTTPPKGMAYWERLSVFINNNYSQPFFDKTWQPSEIELVK